MNRGLRPAGIIASALLCVCLSSAWPSNSSLLTAVSARQMARESLEGLLPHFWIGDATVGHILDTWNGYRRSDDPRGVLWERATFIAVLDNLYRLTQDR